MDVKRKKKGQGGGEESRSLHLEGEKGGTFRRVILLPNCVSRCIISMAIVKPYMLMKKITTNLLTFVGTKLKEHIAKAVS